MTALVALVFLIIGWNLGKRRTKKPPATRRKGEAVGLYDFLSFDGSEKIFELTEEISKWKKN